MNDLGPAGQALHDAITGEYELRTDERAVLLSACRLADRIEQLEDHLRTAPLLVPGAKDRDVPNPMIAEVRHFHLALATLLGRLGLGAEEGADPSAAARAMNRHRHHGAGRRGG